VLDTDRANTDEIAAASRATAPRLAVWFYRDRLAEGYTPTCARCMAILYLRRKTGLSWPLAAAAFDQHNQEN
jgi:hypothetical protein